MEKIVAFECYVDLRTCLDSMLFDSDTTVASMQYTDNGVSIGLDLMVRGSVHVCVTDENGNAKDYRKPSEFPEDLTDKIKTNPNWDEWEGEDSSISILENNWFEYIFTVDHDWSDGEMCEERLCDLTPDDLKAKMAEVCERLVKDNTDD